MSGAAPKADALPGCAIPRHAELLGFSLVSPRVSMRTKAEYQGERGMNLRTFPGIVPESVRDTFGRDALTYGGWKWMT